MSLHLHNVVARVQYLENVSSVSSLFVKFSLGPTSFLPSASIFDSKLASFSSELSLTKSSILNLTSKIGQNSIEIGTV